jgi:glutaminyl-tRNA synthetase
MKTRFPPEPNGYLHLGHAKSICYNFGLAKESGGSCNLRFDDTNPSSESMEFVNSIQNDIKWLGFDWGDNMFFASDYYEELLMFCISLIEKGKAYISTQTEDQIRIDRGTITEAGRPDPNRDNSVEQNLDLLAFMRFGHPAEGSHVVRLKIDMANPNMKMRDPIIYRILYTPHYRTGTKWSLYPMYDFAHCLSDWKEGISDSFCTLEFENNRELYDWILNACGLDNLPVQKEFARLNVTHTVLSKRNLSELVSSGTVSGWDDPRLPTLAGMRRRGYTAESIIEFCNTVGVSRHLSTVEIELLEHIVRNSVSNSPVVMCVLDPVRLTIDGSRTVYIERDDFMENPVPGYHRLAPGTKVRLKNLGIVRCVDLVKDTDGKIIEIKCVMEPECKVKGTIHWVDEKSSTDIEVRLYDRLFSDAEATILNENSLKVVTGKIDSSSVSTTEVGKRYQFMRLGYFIVDSISDHITVNRIISLKDSWNKK